LYKGEGFSDPVCSLVEDQDGLGQEKPS